MSYTVYILLHQWWRVGSSGLDPRPTLGLELKPKMLADAFLKFFSECDLDPLGSFDSYGITQLGPPSSAKLLSGGATTKD